MRFVYGALTLCGGTFQNPSTTQQLCNSVEGLVPLLLGPTTPCRQRHQALAPAPAARTDMLVRGLQRHGQGWHELALAHQEIVGDTLRRTRADPR
jgi:hypothetical protein